MKSDEPVSEGPIFRRATDGAWLPEQTARGPFAGIQGGAVAALMCSQVEALAQAEDLGFVASFSAHFLKPTPLDPLVVGCERLRNGRRVSLVDVRLAGPTGVSAVGRAVVISPLKDAMLPTPPLLRIYPTRYPLTTRVAPHGGPWLMDEMEVREAATGVAWFRLRRSINEDAGAMSKVLAAADWAHGIGLPMGASTKPSAAIPNPDLTVRLSRAPLGAWVGVQAVGLWSTDSIGAAWATLHDERGPIGQVSMSVAISAINQDQQPCAN